VTHPDRPTPVDPIQPVRRAARSFEASEEEAAIEHRYRVRVAYVEPTYAAARDIPFREYCGEFDVRAGSFEDAVAQGLAAFRAAALTSGVGWERRVTSVSCVIETEEQP
jgi:hypothetical protein